MRPSATFDPMYPIDETVVETLWRFLQENPDATIEELEDALDAADVMDRAGDEVLDFEAVVQRLKRKNV